jgi:hypothetical protein
MPAALKLLPGEDPGTGSLSDAEHWTAVFQELVEQHQALLSGLGSRPEAPIQGEADLLEGNLAWLRGRLKFWRRRRHALSGAR